MHIISVRQQPEYAQKAIAFFQEKWGNAGNKMVYDDCITHCIGAKSPLPQWYLLCDGDTIVGGAGLITNDFISRGDLCPWVCAVYIEERYRGRALGGLLLEQAKKDAKSMGYDYLYLCTDHIGYYERFGFSCIGMGYHPWGESSRIYEAALVSEKSAVSDAVKNEPE